MAKSEVEALKTGKVVIRTGFGNMVTKKPSIKSQFALVLQHFAASFHDKQSLNATFDSGLTFLLAQKAIPIKVQGDFDALINKLVE